MELKQDPKTGWWNRGVDYFGNEMVITRMHDTKLCEGRGCAMHNHPSFHPLFDAPMRWTGVLDRRCKHGIWHADRDEIAYYESINMERQCEPDCDDCCTTWDKNE